MTFERVLKERRGVVRGGGEGEKMNTEKGEKKTREPQRGEGCPLSQVEGRLRAK